MEELNFHRKELDGRNQCKSELARILPNGRYPRCKLEQYHPLEHAGDGFIWSNDQQRQGEKFMSRWLANLARLTALVVLLAAYAILQAYFNPTVHVPIWFLVISLATLASIFFCLTGLILDDVKKRVKKDVHG